MEAISPVIFAKVIECNVMLEEYISNSKNYSLVERVEIVRKIFDTALSGSLVMIVPALDVIIREKIIDFANIETGWGPELSAEYFSKFFPNEPLPNELIQSGSHNN